MERYSRKPIRLTDHDYSKAGAYFITLCVKDRHCILWDVGETSGRPGRKYNLSYIGKIIEEEIVKLSTVYGCVSVGRYVVMPNHVHLIIVIYELAGGRPQVAPTISRIIQQFKGSVTKQAGFSIWQKLFHDHIIRSDEEYCKISQYIDANPDNWQEDEYHKNLTCSEHTR